MREIIKQLKTKFDAFAPLAPWKVQKETEKTHVNYF